MKTAGVDIQKDGVEVEVMDHDEEPGGFIENKGFEVSDDPAAWSPPPSKAKKEIPAPLLCCPNCHAVLSDDPTPEGFRMLACSCGYQYYIETKGLHVDDRKKETARSRRAASRGRALIVTAYNSGMSSAKVGLKYGVSGPTVIRYVRAAGFTVRTEQHSKLNPEDRALAVALYKTTEPVKNILHRFDISHTLLLKCVREAGCPLRQPHRPRSKP